MIAMKNFEDRIVKLADTIKQALDLPAGTRVISAGQPCPRQEYKGENVAVASNGYITPCMGDLISGKLLCPYFMEDKIRDAATEYSPKMTGDIDRDMKRVGTVCSHP